MVNKHENVPSHNEEKGKQRGGGGWGEARRKEGNEIKQPEDTTRVYIHKDIIVTL